MRHPLILFLSFILGACQTRSDPIIWEPAVSRTDALQVCMMLIPGSSISVENLESEFTPFVHTLQSVAAAESPAKRMISLWVVMPQPSATDMTAGNVLQESMEALARYRGNRRRFSRDRSQRPFGIQGTEFTYDLLIYAAHEDGFTRMETVVQEQRTKLLRYSERFAEVYFASFKSRSLALAANDSPTSRLTVFGELDGVRRVMRYAIESFHDLRQNNGSSHYAMIPGANHRLLTVSDPWKQYDLVAERPIEDIFMDVSKAVVGFAHGQLESTQTLSEISMDALTLFRPIWDAMILEGCYNLLPPCHIFDDRHPQRVKVPCFLSSVWTEMTQKRMALGPSMNSSRVDVNVHDEFHFSWTVRPIHHPYIGNKCNKNDPMCTININTVSHNVYDLDFNQNPFTSVPAPNSYVELPLSAMENKAKMKSRQSFLVASGNRTARFEENDGGPRRCAELNQLAWEWVLRRFGVQVDATNAEFWDALESQTLTLPGMFSPTGGSPTSTVLKRFRDRLINGHIPPMIMADDNGPIFNVLTWMFTDLETTYNNTARQLVVRSSVSRFSELFPLKFSRGMQYCKLLSPARAMEWFLTDGLRPIYAL